ncbi:MAG TPA: HAD-IIIA family hydrolase [Deltaproteobacteria bacterium]|nr:HAD-IIIA family hydrolase [Deltaproteobacteria bacterium]HPR55749.1 HAD-IIIA family hydrolase [Deltaproteobacteria bacterium]HXK47535.1 HAD-IIIA family hydrolase [Deltaproteobacteria bacterium]
MNSIACMVFDVDGVLTDGGISITDSGEEIKTFNSRDGHGMKLLMRAGIEVAILTGRTSRVVDHRAKELGITHVIQGAKDKKAALLDLAARIGIEPSRMAYMGDDVIDLPPMALCSLTFAPGDAMEMVRQRADVVTTLPGGRGAAREAIEVLLKRLDLFDKVMERYAE